MKRVLICAGLAVTLVFPATAAARVRSFQGAVNPNGTVQFKVKLRHGDPVRVKGSARRQGFTWEGVPIQCETGSLPWEVLSWHLPFSIEVEGRTFHGKGSNGNAIAKVRGRFRRNGKKARGILRVRGDLPGMGAWGCDSGRRHWSAHRLPA